MELEEVSTALQFIVVSDDLEAVRETADMIYQRIAALEAEVERLRRAVDDRSGELGECCLCTMGGYDHMEDCILYETALRREGG